MNTLCLGDEGTSQPELPMGRLELELAASISVPKDEMDDEDQAALRFNLLSPWHASAALQDIKLHQITRRVIAVNF